MNHPFFTIAPGTAEGAQVQARQQGQGCQARHLSWWSEAILDATLASLEFWLSYMMSCIYAYIFVWLKRPGKSNFLCDLVGTDVHYPRGSDWNYRRDLRHRDLNRFPPNLVYMRRLEVNCAVQRGDISIVVPLHYHEHEGLLIWNCFNPPKPQIIVLSFLLYHRGKFLVN